MRLFFFQAEDGIRVWSVTGVQTCALPISLGPQESRSLGEKSMSTVVTQELPKLRSDLVISRQGGAVVQIGRASCRERVKVSVVGATLKQKQNTKSFVVRHATLVRHAVLQS